MRHESSQRLLFSMTLLAALWIVVYWSWGPRDVSPTLSFDERSSVSEAGEGSQSRNVQANPSGQSTGATELIPGLNPEQPLRVKPPEFREYTVRAEQTLEHIALDVYGDSNLWRAIAQANPLKDAERMRVGDVIRVPIDPGNIQGVVVTDQGERVDPPKPVEPEFVEYVVKSGDSLSEISLQYYGTARHARLIFEANQDSLDNMSDLKIGATIRLPAAPIPEG